MRLLRPFPLALALLAGCEAAVGADCRFRPDYHPAPLSSRVAPRD